MDNERANLQQIRESLKKSFKKESDMSNKDELAVEIGQGAGKAFGWVLVACTKIAIEVFKVFVAIWLLHYFGFLPLNG